MQRDGGQAVIAIEHGTVATTEVAAVIREELARGQRTTTELSRDCGIDERELRRILRGATLRTKEDKADRIFAALRRPDAWFFGGAA